MPDPASHEPLVIRRPLVVLAFGIAAGVLSWAVVLSTPARPNLSGMLQGPTGHEWVLQSPQIDHIVVSWPKVRLSNKAVQDAARKVSAIPAVRAKVLSCKHQPCLLLFVDRSKTPRNVLAVIQKELKEATGQPARLCGTLPLLAKVRPTIRRWGQGALIAAALLLVMFLLTGGGLRGVVLLTVTWFLSAGLVAALWRLLHSAFDLMAILPGLALTATVTLATKRLVDAAGWSGQDSSAQAARAAYERERGPQFLIAGVAAISLLAMAASRFPGLRWPAIWAATAVLAAVLTTLFVGTAILAIWPRSFKRHRQASLLSRWVGQVQEGAANWPRLGLWAGALLVAALAFVGLKADVAVPLEKTDHDAAAPCLVALDLVVTASTDMQSDKDGVVLHRLTRRIGAMSEVEAIYPNEKQAGTGKGNGIISRWHRPGPDPSVHHAVLVRTKDTAQVAATAHRVTTEANRILRAQPNISAHVTGPITEGARTATALSRSYILGIVRFLGMVLMLLVALTWDPRLGLTVALPAAASLVMLLAVLSLLHKPVTLPVLGGFALVSVWATMDAFSSVLEAARSRRAGASLPRHAASSSLRAALSVGVAILVGAGYCISAPFAPAALVAGAGILLAALLSAYGVPTLLAFMPGARLLGPLWEPRKRRPRKKKLRRRPRHHSKRKRTGTRRTEK